MKYLKTYENINEPEIGDYAICLPNNLLDKSEDFFNNTIGKIYNILRREGHYCIEYDDIPYDIKNFYCAWRKDQNGKQYLENKIWFGRDMIKYYGKTKEEVELKKSSNKYNL